MADDFRSKSIKQETVRLNHELFHGCLPDDPVDKIRPQKGFTSIEGKLGGGIFLQETIELVQTEVQFRRKKGIDFYLWKPFILNLIHVLKCPCPAVAAAEVAVVGEDKVEVQENPSHYET